MSSIIENSIISSSDPIPIPNERNAEMKIVNNQTGIWMNKNEEINWRGILPISDYSINKDSNPEHIIKTIERPVHYIQSIFVKLLRPPTPPPHGDLIIKQESDIIRPTAPPIIIRQDTERSVTPEPLIIREKPPEIPLRLPEQRFTIPGKIHSPPPRRVVIEKLPELPEKPHPIIIEKWLPFERQKRRVVFEEPVEKVKPPEPVKNLVIEWRQPNSVIKRELVQLGIENTDPDEYLLKYGKSLKHSSELAEYSNELMDIKYCQQNSSNENLYDLEGDIDKLNLLDSNALEILGLSRHGSFKTNNLKHRSINHNGLHAIELKKEKNRREFGLVIRGGSDFNMPLYVIKLISGSSAVLDGRILIGDEIIQINGILAHNLKLIEAVEIFKSNDSVRLLIKRTGLSPPSVSDFVDSIKNGLQV